MTIRNVQLSLTIIAVLFGTNTIFAKPIDEKFYGSYYGISLVAAKSGASLDESVVILRVDRDGVHRTENVGTKKFEVFYSPDWLVDVRTSVELDRHFPKKLLKNSEYLAIKENLEGDVPKSVFEYVSPSSMLKVAARIFNQNSKFDIIETSDDDASPLAVYIKMTSSPNVPNDLKTLYEAQKSDSPKPPSAETSIIDEAADLKILESTREAFEKKTAVLDQAQRDIMNASRFELKKRLSLFKFAIEKSDDANLIIYTLKKCGASIFLPEIVPLISDAIDASMRRIEEVRRFFNEDEILSAAVEALEIQLVAARAQHRIVFEIESRFKTADIAKIEAATGGKITNEEASLLRAISSFQQENRFYTKQDLVNMFSLLERLNQSHLKLPKTSDERPLSKVKQILENNPDPYKCKVALAKVRRKKSESTENK